MKTFASSTFLLFAFLGISIAQTTHFDLQVCAKFWKTDAAIRDIEFVVPDNSVADLLGFTPDRTCMFLQFSPVEKVHGFCPDAAFRTNDDPLNGVTVRDILLTYKHIYGADQLPIFHQLLAGDVNRSGSISTFDIIEMIKWMLGQPPSQGNLDWQALTDYEFLPSPFVPWNNPDSCSGYQYEQGTTNGTATLIGYKKGDVDGDANPSGKFEIPYEGNAVSFDLPDLALKAGETKDLTIQNVFGGEKCLGFQTELAYDPNFIRIVSVAQTVEGGSFQFNHSTTPSGSLRILSFTSNFSAVKIENITIKVEALKDCYTRNKISSPRRPHFPDAFLDKDSKFRAITVH